jgi:hypothetical protein
MEKEIRRLTDELDVARNAASRAVLAEQVQEHFPPAFPAFVARAAPHCALTGHGTHARASRRLRSDEKAVAGPASVD